MLGTKDSEVNRCFLQASVTTSSSIPSSFIDSTIVSKAIEENFLKGTYSSRVLEHINSPNTVETKSGRPLRGSG